MNMQDTSRRVVVTGMGVVSALGSTLEEFQRSCREGRSGVRATTANEPFPITCVAPVDDFTGKIQDFGEPDDAKKKAIRKGVKLMAREIQLGVASAQRALADSGAVGAYPSQRVGVSFASDYVVTTPQELIDAIADCRRKNESGETVFDAPRWREDGMSKMTPLWQLKYLTNMSASHITIYNEFFGPAFDVTDREASFSGALGDAVETIRQGRADAMLVGATGSRIHPLRLIEAIKCDEIADDAIKANGATEPTVCRPFDARRCGTIPGEGAGALFIESLETARRRGARIYAEVVGGVCRGVFRHSRGVRNADGVCDVAISRDDQREAICSALKRLLEKCGFDPKETGHINANARGDVNLDSAEASALRDVFGDALDAVPTTSLKGILGNPGAGAGAIETVASILAFQNDALFPTVNFEIPDKDCPVVPTRVFGVAPGDSFIKICAQSVGQASAALIRRWRD